ncbi:helix-turn-helix transcriptional regulator [Oceanispirochaeta sp. M2]|uniref:helix-turn-helix transcriptional regulator n=1 Tax=Oceanispirochaeta sp. M2 TaxID=2735869 RepID=UPI001551EA9E|nr:helix-turn-helix transcriptional regulator [Oceanispirochaeta sp. M2]MBF9017801.1 hypothetical protein [Oceanispirochaeta sp. M2]
MKLFLIGIFVVLFIELSVFLKQDVKLGIGLNYIIYLIFFLSFIHISYTDEIRKILKIETKVNEKIESIEEELRTLTYELEGYQAIVKEKETRINNLNHDIEKLNEPWTPIDIGKYKISEQEERTIRELCQNTELTNKEIAAALGVKEGTIKQNLNRIYKKLGVANRQKTIELCQQNYLTHPLKN